jgi:hypothetical protein
MHEIAPQTELGTFIAVKDGQEFAQFALVVREPRLELQEGAADARAAVGEKNLVAALRQVEGGPDAAHPGADD